MVLFSLFALTGCFSKIFNIFKKPNTDGPDDGPGGTPSSEIIFGGDFKVIVPENFDEDYSELLFELDAMLVEVTGKATDIKNDAEQPYTHEILFGNTNRELSTKAYRRLERLIDTDEDLIGYVVYSDGKSIAIAYNSIESLELALDELAGNYLSADYNKSTVPEGVLHSWSYKLSELFEERDAVIMQERWTALTNEINKAGYNGDATVRALQSLYSRYTDDIYFWMADLYDPDLGGFYYSNSGRNTLGYLPDIESTMQILNFIRYSGMNNQPASFPDEFKAKLIEFVKTKQSPVDGYFYHPQWEDLVTTDERRGRDQSWALEILRMFSEKPLYTTGGVTGTLGEPTGTAPTSYMTSPIKGSSVIAVSRVIATATLPHLQSQSAFKAYLDSQDWTDAYTTGNRLAAQVTSIKSAGLLPYCVEYLNGRQKANGMWDDQLGERATNGFLKIAAIYETAGTVIPRSEEASEFLIELLLSEEPDGTVCWTYNVWYSLDIIISLLNNSGRTANITLAAKIRDDLRTNAASYIATTTQKYTPFLKEGKVFSFNPDKTSSHSQGMPVAVSGAVEGDVNATYISSIGLIGYIFDALGYERVLPYTENDYKLFIKYLSGLSTVIKTGTAADGSINFNDISNLDNIFHATSNVVSDLTPDLWEDEDPNSAGAILVDEGEDYGQVLEYYKPNAGLETRIEFANRSINRSSYIYELDLKFMGGNVESGSWHTRFAMYNNGRRFWSILAYTLDDGSLALGDRNDPIAVISANQWHTLRFEYYTDTADRACKIYVDGVYVGEGGTSDPTNGDGGLSRVFIEYRNEATDLLYRFDNILVKSENTPYTPPTIDAGDSIGSHYKDPAFKGERYDYDSEEPRLPALIGKSEGVLSVVDGRLNFSLKNTDKSDTIIYNLAISAAEAKYEHLCKLFELEFSYGNITSDQPISFYLGNQEYTLVKDPETGRLNMVDKYNAGRVIETALEANTVYVIRFECYQEADNSLYNISKVYINDNYAGELRSDYTGGVTKLGVKLDASLAGSDAFVTVENLLIANINKAYTKEASEGPDTLVRDPIEGSTIGGGDYYKDTSVEGNRFDCSEIIEGDSGMKTDGVTSGSDDTAMIIDGSLVYTRNNLYGESYMRWNHELTKALTSPVFIFESDFRFDGFNGNSPSQKIIIQANGISHQITPEFEVVDGVQTMILGKMTLSEGVWYNIRFEADYEAGMLYYFLDGSYAGFDYLSKTTTTYKRIIWYYLTKQTAGSMRFDNTFEALVEEGTMCKDHIDSDSDGICDNCPMDMDEGGEIVKPEIGNVPQNGLSGGSFYNGTAAGNRFDCNSVADGMQVDGVTENDAVGISNGIFVFTRNNSTGKGESYIRWNLAKPEGFTTPIFVFETDFVFTDYTATSITSQKIVIEANGIKHIILPSLSEDRLTMTFGKMELKSGEWNNLRFELDYAAGMIYYFKNGEYCGFDYLSKDTTSGNRVLWYYMAPQTAGSMGFDNTYYGFVEDGSICDTHTDADGDGKCDKCPLDMPAPPKPEVTLPDNTIGGGDYYKGSESGNRFDCNELISGDAGMKIDGVSANDEAEFKNGVFIFTRNNDTGKGESYVRWNHMKSSAFISPVFIFETDFIFKDLTANSITAQKIVIEANGIQHIVLPSLSEDRQTMTIGSESCIVIKSGEWNNIRFELDYAAGMIYYFQNGEYKGSDYLSKNTTSNNRVLWYYMAPSTGGSMGFDNTFEGLLEDGSICGTHTDADGDGKCDNCPLDMPEPPKPEVTIPDNTIGGGDYYKGTESGSRFDCDEADGNLKTDGITQNDEAIYKNGMLIFERNNDSGTGESYLRWNPPSASGKIFVFETDFFFTGFAEKEQTSLLRFLISPGVDYQLKPSVSADGKTMTVGKFELSSDTWYNLRFEIEVATGSVNYFLNGSFIGKGALSAGTASYTGRVLWYYLGPQTDGIMAFDNTFLGYVNESSFVCEDHIDADNDGKCDLCEEAVEPPPPVDPDPPVIDPPTVDPEAPDNDNSLGDGDYKDNTDDSGWM